MKGVTLLFLSLLFAFSAQAQTFFTASLTSAQEPSDVMSEATGTAALALSEEGLHFFVTVDGLSGPITGAHFHQGEAGVNGGVVRAITDDFVGNTASGVWTAGDGQPLTDELIAALLTGDLYLNIHTAANGGGEIRGQVLPTSGTGLSASLTPEQEPGDVMSEGSGTASVQLTDAGVLYFATVTGLTGPLAAAHFHEAPAGVNGGVVRGIDFVGNTAFGLWTPDDGQPLTDALIETLLTGGLYLNIHTAANGGGEIRGQVRLSSGWGFSAALDPGQEPGTVTSDGSGSGSITLTEAGLVYNVTVTGLTGEITGAHFHNAPAGTNGGVVRAIDFVGNTASGVWRPSDGQPLTDELIREMIAGNIYVNIHTAANGGGEIRGQVLPDPDANLTATLTPEQEMADVVSDGSGTAALVLTGGGLRYQITVDGLTGEIAGAHFHQGEAGVNGGVVRGITEDFVGNTASGVWTAGDAQPLTDELIAALLTGGLYLNIHTAANGGGEIRGQVHLSEGAALRAFLTPEQEMADVVSDGGGTAALTLTEAGLVFDVTVDGLTGEIAGAHFHQGEAGVNGGVVRGITEDFVGNTASGVWTAGDAQPLTDELIAALLTGGLYLNIHTAANGGGEIRGQVHLSGGVGAAVALDPEQENAGVVSDGTGTAALTLTSAGLVYDLTATGLTGPIAAAHFHNAPAGTNGGVVRGIGDSFTGNTASGVWRPSDEQALTGELLNELLAGNIYINLHTAANGGGEIRGQVFPGEVVVTAIETVDGEVPARFALAQNYPNPFNPATRITFDLPHATHARLAVYDVLGRQVATLVEGPLPAGQFRVTFEGASLPSGLYYYRLEAEGTAQTRAMLLLK